MWSMGGSCARSDSRTQARFQWAPFSPLDALWSLCTSDTASLGRRDTQCSVLRGFIGSLHRCSCHHTEKRAVFCALSALLTPYSSVLGYSTVRASTMGRSSHPSPGTARWFQVPINGGTEPPAPHFPGFRGAIAHGTEKATHCGTLE